MAPALPTSSSSPASLKGLTWRPTKIMNVHDLSKDDDFLSHLLVEKLGTGTVPLVVHKMDPSQKLPKTNADELMRIVQRLVITKGPIQQVVRQAVDELLTFPSIRYYLKSYTQKQINAFATHASRYFELYHPSGLIEIAHTSRYSHHTGKSELCILATRLLAPGMVITELKGSMANLTDEEDKELKRTDLVHSDIRRDFSVIHSKSMKKNHLFLGPARFVNHDCDNNCELFREGRYITFRVLRPIAIGEEITAHYGDGYFGRKNRHCLCETCEKNGRGGYAEQNDDDLVSSSSSSSDSDSDSDTSSSDSDEGAEEKPVLNLNERRTRRGVYAVISKKDEDSDESEDEDDNKIPLAGAKDVPSDGEIELSVEVDVASELTSLASSNPPSETLSPARSTPSLRTPGPAPGLSRSSSSLTSLSSSVASSNATPSRSSISAQRRGKELQSIPITNGGPSSSSASSTPIRRSTRSTTSLFSSTRIDNGKGKEKQLATPVSTPSSMTLGKTSSKADLNIKKEEAETRVLRMRHSVPNLAEAAKETPLKREVPRGLDGKPLPTCVTCDNVLPVISVDSKVVWGLGPESKKGKKQKQECPRCMRHAAIYQQPWPCRVPPAGTVLLPTPREVTPVESRSRQLSNKILKYLKEKLIDEASKSVSTSSNHLVARKRGREGEERDKDAHPSKKRKAEPVTVKVKKTASPKKAPESTNSDEHPVKRKRGRPRLSSPRYRPKVKTVQEVLIKEEETVVELPSRRLFSQPRAHNGRFGKKDKTPRKSGDSNTNLSSSPRSVKSRSERMASRLIESPKVTWTSPRRKRSNDEAEVSENPQRKKVQRNQPFPHVQDVQSDLQLSLQKVLPRPASTFRGGRLVSNPNPLRFALHAWAGPVVLDDSSEEDESTPDTPEDIHSHNPDIITGDELSASALLPAPILPRAPLIYKPSPFAFSKRRWVSLSTLPERLTVPGSHLNNKGTDPSESISDHVPTGKKDRSGGRMMASYSSRWSKTLITDEDSMEVSTKYRLTPLTDPYPLRRISDENQFSTGLKQVYPAFPLTDTAPQLHRATSFSSLPGSIPSLVNAGWDSSSDTSE